MGVVEVLLAGPSYLPEADLGGETPGAIQGDTNFHLRQSTIPADIGFDPSSYNYYFTVKWLLGAGGCFAVTLDKFGLF